MSHPPLHLSQHDNILPRLQIPPVLDQPLRPTRVSSLDHTQTLSEPQLATSPSGKSPYEIWKPPQISLEETITLNKRYSVGRRNRDASSPSVPAPVPGQSPNPKSASLVDPGGPSSLNGSVARSWRDWQPANHSPFPDQEYNGDYDVREQMCNVKGQREQAKGGQEEAKKVQEEAREKELEVIKREEMVKKLEATTRALLAQVEEREALFENMKEELKEKEEILKRWEEEVKKKEVENKKRALEAKKREADLARRREDAAMKEKLLAEREDALNHREDDLRNKEKDNRRREDDLAISREIMALILKNKSQYRTLLALRHEKAQSWLNLMQKVSSHRLCNWL